METFFQILLPTVKAVKSFLAENKNVKVMCRNGLFQISTCKSLTNHEKELSCKEFTFFIKKKVLSISIENLPMGEREALVEIVHTLEAYIANFLDRSSPLRAELDAEIVSIKLSGAVPSSYIQSCSPDVEFIKKNLLDNIFFYHGVVVDFSSSSGISIPFCFDGKSCVDIPFFELIQDQLTWTKIFSWQGTQLFSTDHQSRFLSTPKIYKKAISTGNLCTPFITYQSCYKSSSVEIFFKDEKFFLCVHDGNGNVYRFGLSNGRMISPDQYVYDLNSSFEKISFPISKSDINEIIQALTTLKITKKEDAVAFLSQYVSFDNQCLLPLTCSNKMLSYLFIPKLLPSLWRGKVTFRDLLKPWTLRKINYKKLKKKKKIP